MQQALELKDFVSYYRRGLIPGPKETRESFSQRVQLHSQKEATVSLKEIYGMEPDWIPVTVSSMGLWPWEAGCTWYEDQTVGIQLHPKRGKSLHREVLTHEGVHAVRSAFEEPRFEEILAYRTSSNVFRRFLGPLFQKPKEAWLFLLASLIDILQFLAWEKYFCCATLLMAISLFIRLGWNQWRLSQCLVHLHDPRLLIGLTDREIICLAKGKTLSDLDDGSLRWKVLKSFASLPLGNEESCDI